MKNLKIVIAITFGLFILILTSANVFAEEPTYEGIEKFMYLHVEVSSDRSAKRLLTEISERDSKINKLHCEEDYDALFKNDVVNIHMTYGYLDNKEFVSDINEKRSLVKSLKLPCPRNVFSCGFVESSESTSKVIVLQKRIVRKSGVSHKVKLHITHSSASGYEFFNRSPEHLEQEQIQQTLIAKDNFFNSLHNGTDASFYIGHSRDGGGPSFKPPVLYNNGNVNYDWYQKHTPGFSKLKSVLRESIKQPAFLALVSCYSKYHFYKDMLRIAPNTGYLLSNYLGRSQNSTQVAMTGLDMLLGRKCKESIEVNLDSIYGTLGPEVGEWGVYNFFKASEE